MNMPIIVNVTAEDIATGVRYRCEYCPVALGTKRATGATVVKASKVWIWVGDHGYHTPKEVREFIRAFDQGEPVEPFSFTLGAPAG